MSQIIVRDLQPGTDYAIQLRTNTGEDVSEWSRLFVITTVADDAPPTVPAWAAISPFVPDGRAFVAKWDAINPALEENLDFAYYEIEFTNGATSFTVKTTNTTYVLSYETNAARFGGAKPAVTARVRAVDATGNASAYNAPITATNPIPAAPVATATAGSNSIDISWTASTSDDVVTYRVYTSGGTKIFEGDTLKYVYNTLTYSAQSFIVRAVDVFGQESANAVTNAVTPTNPFTVDTTAPAVPTGLAASIANNPNGIGGSANVSWTAVSATDLAGYTIRYRRTGSADNYTVVSVDKNTTAVRVDLPLAGTGYTFSVRAYDWSANHSAWSAEVSAAAAANAAPATVTGLVSTAGRDSINYSWTPLTDTDLKNYEVEFSTSNTFPVGATTLTFRTGTSPSLTVGGLSTGTTYYARVRAVDQLGLASGWSTVDTETTGSYPVSQPSDGFGPASSPTPAVLSDLSSLYVTWSPVTTNSNGGAQLDPVTYEVHLGTTAGFAVSAATKVTEVSGTTTIIDHLPGTTSRLAYGSDYHVRLVAKDRDAPAAAGTSAGPVQISKIASTDVISIGADLIVPGTGIVANLIINTGGGIQSANYNPATPAGWRISPTGAEFLDSGSTVRAEAIKAGTLGGTNGSGVINIALGTSLVFNGGYLKSNTNTGTTMATAETSGAGFYLGNDGLFIGGGASGGRVKANALISDTLTSTVITLGTGGRIVGGSGWELNDSGLTIPNGGIQAASLNIQTGPNLLSPIWASFETALLPATTNPVTRVIETGNAMYGTQSIRISHPADTSMDRGFYLGTTASSDAIPVIVGKKYIISGWAKNNLATPATLKIAVYNVGANSWSGVVTVTVPASQGWTRYSGVYTIPANTTGITPYFSVAQTGAFDISIDAAQVEEQVSNSTVPSTWTAGGYTSIDGSMIKTGAIRSTNNATVNGVSEPVWSIPLNGAATFTGMRILGSTVLGNGELDTTSVIQSSNYIQGAQGWRIRANGDAEFAAASLRGTLSIGQVGGLQGRLDIAEAAQYVDDFSDMSRWTANIGGNLTYRTDIQDFGGQVLQSNAQSYSLYGNARIPFDEGVLYKVTVRLRAESGAPNFYLGVRPYAADKTTLVGTNWYGIANQEITELGSWREYTAYFRGSETVNGINGGTIAVPGKLPVGTKYFSPLVLFNYQPVAGDVLQASMYKVEAVSQVDTVMDLWGATDNVTLIDGGHVKTKTLTLDTLISGSLDSQITMATGSYLSAKGTMGEEVTFGSAGFKVIGPHEANITAASRTATTVTITTSKNHGYAVGSDIYIEGLDTTTTNHYDGLYTAITGTTGSTIVYTKAGVSNTATSTVGAIAYGLDTENPGNVREPQPIYVEFPTTIAKPNIISGTLQASLLTVSRGATFRGTVGIEVGSVFNIASAILAPKAAPTVTATYDPVSIKGLPVNAVVKGIVKGHNGNLFVLSNSVGTSAGGWSKIGANTGAGTYITEHTTTGAFVAQKYYYDDSLISMEQKGESIVYYNNNYYVMFIFGSHSTLGMDIFRYDTSFTYQDRLDLGGMGTDGSPTDSVIGWNHTGNALIYAFLDESNNQLKVKEIAINATTGAFGAIGAVTSIAAVGTNFSNLGFVARGTFNYAAADRYVFKSRVSDTTNLRKNFVTTTAAGAAVSTEYWPSADGTDVHGGYYDASVNEFFDIDSTYTRRRYVGGDSFWTSPDESIRWFGYSFLKTGGAQTNMSPRRSFTLPKRAQAAVTISPIPGGTSTALPDAARLWVARQDNDPGPTGTIWKLRNTINYPSTTAKVNPYQVPGTAQPVATNGFGTASNPGMIQSTTGESYWKGDDSAQFKQLRIMSNVSAAIAGGNTPPLKVGNLDPAGNAGSDLEHFRIDGNSIIAMSNNTVRGTMDIAADTVTFNMIAGGLIFEGGTLFSAKIRTTNDLHTSLVLDANKIVAATATFNGGTVTANNTTVFHAGSIQTYGQIMANDGGPIITTAAFRMDSPTVGSFTANVNWNSTNGYLRVVSSSKKYKENIRKAKIDTRKVLDLQTRTFQRNDEYSDDETPQFIGYRKDNPWYIGFIAEEAQELGLTDWVEYGPDAEPSGFAYANWSVALHAVAQEHDAEIIKLKKEKADLATRVARLEALVEQIVG